MTDVSAYEPSAAAEGAADVGKLRDSAHALLRNALAGEAAYEPFKGRYARSQSEELRGIAGFVLMMRALERGSREPSAGSASQGRNRLLAEAAELLADEAVAEEMMRVYEIPSEYSLRSGRIHRVGTTSVILECRDTVLGRDIALKCVLFRYSAVPEITSQTGRYAERYDFGENAKFAPRVYASGRLYIAMELIRGSTLADRLRQQRDDLLAGSGRKRTTSTEIVRAQIGSAAKLGAELARILGELAHAGTLPGRSATNHLDLTPNNIMLREGSDEVVLLDFGLNYLIAEDVGSTSAIAAAGEYVAPECLDPAFASKTFEQKALADSYSLALVVLSCATLDSVATHRELSLQALWRVAPGHARVLEDLLDENPERRCVLLRSEYAGEQQSVFPAIGAAIEEEVEAQRIFYDVQDHDGLGLAGRVWRQWFVDRQTVKAMVRLAVRSRRSMRHNYRPFASLATASAICGFMWLLVLLGAFLFTVPYPGPGLGNDPGRTVLELFRSTYHPAHYVAGEYLPARIVAVAFGTLAFTAYMNIYSTLEFSGLPSDMEPLLWLKVRGASFFARTTVVVPFLPMLWAIYYSPKDWPVLTVPGVLWATTTNAFAFAVWKEGTNRAGGLFSVDPDPDNAFRDQFKWWVYAMGIFAGALAVFAAWFEITDVKDAMPYAVVIAVLTVFQVSFGRCITQGAQVRGRLLRGVFDLRRSLLLRPRLPPRMRPPGPREWLHAWSAYLRIGRPG